MRDIVCTVDAVAPVSSRNEAATSLRVRSRRCIRVAAVTVSLGAALSAPAHAGSCPPVQELHEVDPALAGLDAEARLAWLKGRFDVGARKSGAWALSWGLTYTALTAGLFTASAFVDPQDRVDLYVGGASAGIGLVSRAILLPRAWLERRRLRRTEFETTCQELAAYEQAMLRAARSEKRGRALFTHLTALAYNAAVGFTLGFGFKRPLSANRQFSIGAVVGQTMLVTQPMVMVEALEQYEAAALPSTPRLSSSPLIVPGGGGFNLSGRF